GAVVLIAQKCLPPKLHVVSWVREKWTARADAINRVPTGGISPIPQSLFVNQPHAELRYLFGTVQGTLIEQLHVYVSKAPEAEQNHFVPLSACVSIRRGEELGKDSTLLS